MRRLNLVIGVVVVIGIAAGAEAAPILWGGPYGYAQGANLSNVLEGVTFRVLTNGPDGQVASPAIRDFDPLLGQFTIARDTFGLDHYSVCEGAMIPASCLEDYKVLEVTFENPTNYVTIFSAWAAVSSDRPGVLLYDSLGRLLDQRTATLSGQNGIGTVFLGEHYVDQMALVDGKNIARVVFGGYDRPADAIGMYYGRVPTPSTLLMVSIGALALLRKRRF